MAATLAARYIEDDLPAGMPALKCAVRLSGGCQREQVTHHRPQEAIGQQSSQRAGALAVVLSEHAVECDVGVQKQQIGRFSASSAAVTGG